MCGITDPLDCIPDVDDAVKSGVEALAKAISDGVAHLVKNTVSWWINVPAINIEGEGSVVDKLRAYMLPLAIFVAVAGIMYSGIRMALTRKGDGLIDIGRGLFMTALWGTAAGILIPATALVATDEFSSWVLDSATGGKFGERMTLALSTQVANPGLVIVMGILAMIAGLIQAVLMLFREGAVLILTGVVVLAAAGQFNPITRPWLRKVVSWQCALIFYKAGAALVYATGFILIGEGKGAKAMFMGFAVLGLSIVALPAMLKFFNWATGSFDGGGGFAAGLAAGGGALHAASWAGGGSSGGGGGGGGGGNGAADHARYIQQSMGPSGGGGPQGPPGAANVAGGGVGPAPPPVQAAGAAPSAGTVGASAGAGTTAAAGTTTATAGGATAAGAAAGPVGVIGVMTVQGAQMAAQGAKNAANSATDDPNGAS